MFSERFQMLTITSFLDSKFKNIQVMEKTQLQRNVENICRTEFLSN